MAAGQPGRLVGSRVVAWIATAAAQQTGEDLASRANGGEWRPLDVLRIRTAPKGAASLLGS